jgi:NADH:ubiquinone oxidoreductase subunit E
MGAVLALLAAAVAIAFAARPLLRRGRPAEAEATAAISELVSQRDLAIEDLRELDFDHDLGNLSEKDHEELREQSKRRAVAILKQLQAQEGHIDDEIEQAVAALRGGSAPGS